jgi:hypothetical protein
MLWALQNRTRRHRRRQPEVAENWLTSPAAAGESRVVVVVVVGVVVAVVAAAVVVGGSPSHRRALARKRALLVQTLKPLLSSLLKEAELCADRSQSASHTHKMLHWRWSLLGRHSVDIE